MLKDQHYLQTYESTENHSTEVQHRQKQNLLLPETQLRSSSP
jgi:hypothetical protein